MCSNILELLKQLCGASDDDLITLEKTLVSNDIIEIFSIVYQVYHGGR